VFLGDAHNDFTSGVSEATTRTNILAMISQARAAGIIPVLRSSYPEATSPTPPRCDATTPSRGSSAYASACTSRTPTVPSVDSASTTGAWKASYNTDGTHATAASATVAGQRVMDDLAGPLRGGSTSPPWLPTDSIGSSTNLLVNPLSHDDADFNSQAESWNVSQSGTHRRLADAAMTLNLPIPTSATETFVSAAPSPGPGSRVTPMSGQSSRRRRWRWTRTPPPPAAAAARRFRQLIVMRSLRPGPAFRNQFVRISDDRGSARCN
jgi:hypothetical protein